MRYALGGAISLLGLMGLLSGNAHACALDSWSRVQDAGSKLSAVSNARYTGSCGMQSQLTGVFTAYVQDDTPGLLVPLVTEYHARFYLYLSDLQMDNSDTLVIFSGAALGNEPVFNLKLTHNGESALLKVEGFDDLSTGHTQIGAGAVLRSGWRAVEVVWNSASAPGSNNGSLSLLIDGVARETITGIDSDTLSLGFVRLGEVTGNSETITGRIDFDAFTSQRNQTIGLSNKDCGSTSNLVLSNATFLPGSPNCSASNSINLGSRVTIDSNTVMSVRAPRITLSRGFSILKGASVTIGQ